MSRNPATLKGIRRIVQKFVEGIRELGAKGHTGKATLAIIGHYAFDQDGELGLAGGVELDPVVVAEAVEAEIGADADLRKVWESVGVGLVRITFEVDIQGEVE